jgi:hypothetical protein
MGRLRFFGQKEVDIQLRTERGSSPRRLVPWSPHPRFLLTPRSRTTLHGSLMRNDPFSCYLLGSLPRWPVVTYEISVELHHLGVVLIDAELARITISLLG